jgi:hypothetical protein
MSKNNTLADYMARRRLPGNCIRCAKPNQDQSHKTCPECRAKVRAKKEEKTQQAITRQSQADAATIVRRIAVLEMQVDRLRKMLDSSRRAAYQAGRNYGKSEVRQTVRKSMASPRYRDIMDSLFGPALGHIDWDAVRQHGMANIRG